MLTTKLVDDSNETCADGCYLYILFGVGAMREMILF